MPTPQKPEFIDSIISSIGSVASLIVHTVVFFLAFALGIFAVVDWETVLLVLTTIVSLEAIYLAIFIQMSVNRNTASLKEVEHDIDEIQEDVDEIQEDVEELGEDVDEIQEDIEELTEDEKSEAKAVSLEKLAKDLELVLKDIEALKKE